MSDKDFFYIPDALPMTQSTVSNHRRKLKTLTPAIHTYIHTSFLYGAYKFNRVTKRLKPACVLSYYSCYIISPHFMHTSYRWSIATDVTHRVRVRLDKWSIATDATHRVRVRLDRWSIATDATHSVHCLCVFVFLRHTSGLCKNG